MMPLLALGGIFTAAVVELPRLQRFVVGEGLDGVEELRGRLGLVGTVVVLSLIRGAVTAAVTALVLAPPALRAVTAVVLAVMPVPLVTIIPPPPFSPQPSGHDLLVPSPQFHIPPFLESVDVPTDVVLSHQVVRQPQRPSSVGGDNGRSYGPAIFPDRHGPEGDGRGGGGATGGRGFGRPFDRRRFHSSIIVIDSLCGGSISRSCTRSRTRRGSSGILLLLLALLLPSLLGRRREIGFCISISISISIGLSIGVLHRLVAVIVLLLVADALADCSVYHLGI
mmetsp:Transcript_33886/g.101118  ORF Transcript_33886/g.101118 Transcript_33886/m.101118 type:complete len:281 (+) Transcript_33886:1369-2211(+)